MLHVVPQDVATSSSPWEGSPTIVLNGELDFSAREAVATMLRPAEHMKRITIDLRAVTYFDASMLGRLIHLRIAMGLEDHRRVRLLTYPYHARLLRIVQFDALFEVAEYADPGARCAPAGLQAVQSDNVYA